MSTELKKKEKIPNDQPARDIVTGENRKGFSTNLFVTAGAGAGKTRALTTRVINLLLKEELAPEKLVVITYTTKAAQELKERVRFDLERIASDLSHEKQGLASRQLEALPAAKIGTVHAFCLDLLKEYPIEFQLDPSSDITDDRQNGMIEQEVRKDFIYEMSGSGKHSKEVYAAYERVEAMFGSKQDTIFDTFVTLYQNRELKAERLDSRSSEIPEIKKSLTKIVKDLCQIFCEKIDEVVTDKTDRLYLAVSDIRAEISQFGIDKGQYKQVPDLIDYLVTLSEKDLPFKNIGTAKNYQGTFLKDYKGSLPELKALLKEYRAILAVATYHDLLDLYPIYESLYTDYKARHGLLDFGDCLLIVRGTLKDNTELKRRLQNRFEAIIVDEFQDSDPLQSEILFHLCSENTDPKMPWDKQKLVPGKLCVVGDPKQSIYGFARADISIFLRVMEVLSLDSKDVRQVFTTNFRSNSRIVSFINDAFAALIQKREDEPLASPEYSAMESFSDDKVPETQVKALELSVDLKDDLPGEGGVKVKGGLTAGELRTREAWLVSGYIAGLIKEKKAEAGDFLILFRKRTSMEDYVKMLEHFSVPAVNESPSSFLSDKDVLPLISLLGLFVHPDNPHYLEATLRGACGNYTDEELFRISEDGKALSLEKAADKDSLCQRLWQVSQLNAPLYIRFEAACEALGLLSSATEAREEGLVSAVFNISELIRSEIMTYDYDEGRLLQSLINGALATRFVGKEPSDSIKQEKLILQKAVPNKVRMMTIHGAKGLEAKYVILAHPDDKAMTNVDIIVNREKGTLIPAGINVSGQKLSELPQLQDQMNREEIFKTEEEKRVLYVAATRGAESLIFVTYKAGEFGSFMAPLSSAIGSLPTTELKIDESYRERFAHAKPKEAPVLTEIGTEFWEKEYQALRSKLLDTDSEATSVTEGLKKEAVDVFKVSRDSDSANLGMLFGTFCHEVMEWLCEGVKFGNPSNKAEVEGYIKEHYPGELDPKNIEAVYKALYAFLESPMYESLQKAKTIYTELPFHVPGQTRGVIDLLYQDEQGEYRIVDWKSDTPSTISERKAHYQKQIDAYKEHLSNSFGVEVVSAECYFLFEKN